MLRLECISSLGTEVQEKGTALGWKRNDEDLLAAVKADDTFIYQYKWRGNYLRSDGSQVYIKNTHSLVDADAEEMTHLVADVVNAPVPALVRHSNLQFVLEFVDAPESGDADGFVMGDPDGDLAGALVDVPFWVHDSEDAQNLGILDRLVRNGDRNSGNILVWMVTD